MSSIDDLNPTELRAFFDGYARTSLAHHPDALAAMYAASFIVGGPQGSKTFANDGRFLAWLKQVFDTNRERGMRTLEVVSIDSIALSPAHTLAIVKWGARFERTGERLIEFQISYLLEHAAKGTTILSYISQADEDAEIKALG
jgi:hypothetical protein